MLYSWKGDIFGARKCHSVRLNLKACTVKSSAVLFDNGIELNTFMMRNGENLRLGIQNGWLQDSQTETSVVTLSASESVTLELECSGLSRLLEIRFVC